MEKVKVYFDGELESGAYIQNAMVVLNEDWTMGQVVKAIKESGYKSFMLRTMKRLVRI
jgi:Mg/Co/Ni transporter MgtE